VEETKLRYPSWLPPDTNVGSPRGLFFAASILAVTIVAVTGLKPSSVSDGSQVQTSDEVSQSGISPGAEPEIHEDRTVPDGPTDPEADAEVDLDEIMTQASSKMLEGPERYVRPVPSGNVHNVANIDQWHHAVGAARPGDTIKLTSTINHVLQYRGNRAEASKQTGAHGTADNPITITAAPNVWIDPGNMSNRKPALDVINASHINIVGVNVRNSQFGLRVINSTGTASSPILIADSQINDIGHAGIHVIGRIEDRTPSAHIRIENNVVTRTGSLARQFGEGIYIGYGRQEWLDETTDVAIVGNHVYETGSEAIDLKPGTRNILVEDNLIHDLSPISGGAISAHYVGSSDNPNPDVLAQVIIRRNRIWNVNLDHFPGSNNWAIWVGHGGITIDQNIIWGMQNKPNSTRAVRIRGLRNFGPHPVVVTNNIFWTTTGWASDLSPSPSRVDARGNQGPKGAKGVEQQIDSPNGVPALGSGGDADTGGGPGSAFG